MSDAEIVVAIRGDASGGRVIKRSLDEIADAGDKATTQQQRLEKQLKMTASAGDMLKNAFGGLFAYQTLVSIVKAADNMTMLRGQITNVVKSAQEADRVMASLTETARKTGGSIEAGFSVFQRLSFVRNEIGATNDQMLQFTDTVSKLGALSGANTEAMKNGLTQLGQSLSSELVRAEEFNSIMENIPRVGVEVAKQLGVTTGELRQLVINGKLLSQDVFTAMLNATRDVNAEMESMPNTAEKGFNKMVMGIQQVIDQANSATDGTNAIGKAFEFVGDMAKRVYDGIASFIDIMMAGVAEAVNLALIAVNKLADGINYLKEVVPGANKDMLGHFETFAPGDAERAAAESIKERQSKLFPTVDEQFKITEQSEKERKALQAKYEAELKGLKATEEAKKRAKKIESDLAQAYKNSRTETEKLYDYIKEQEDLKPFAKTADQANAISINIANARKEIAQLAAEAELKSPLGRAFQSLASEIDDGFKDAFKSAFTESDGGFKKLLSGWKNTFKDFLADLAYQALARPIMVSLVGSVGGVMGLSSDAIASALGTTGTSSAGGLGGLGGISNLSSLSSLFSNSTSSLAVSSLDKIGSLFGMGGIGPMQNGGVVGGLSQYSTFTNGSWGGSLGAGVGGFAGNMLGNAVFGGDRGIGASIGGTVGAIAGSFIPIPVLGTMIGAFLGNAIGGLFGGGNKPSDKSQGGTLDFATLTTSTYGQTGKKFSQENADYRTAVLDQAKGLASMFASVGGTTTGSLGILVGSRDGLRLNGQNYGNNSTAFVNAVMQTVVNQTTGITGTFKTILDKIGVSDLNKLQESFAFGQSYDALLNPKKSSDILAEAIKVLDDQMTALIKTATDLGLPTEAYTEALQKQKDASVGALKAQMAGFQTLEDATKTFNSFMDSQALGSSSSMTPLEKLGLAQGNFNDLLTKAQGGDLSVTSDLLASAQTLIDQARNTYSSSTDFSLIEKLVRDSISNIAHTIGIPGYAVGTESALGGLSMLGERGQELVNLRGGEQVFTAGQTAGIMATSGNLATDIARTNAQLINISAETNEEMRQMRKEIVYLRKQYERTANKQAVAG